MKEIVIALVLGSSVAANAAESALNEMRARLTVTAEATGTNYIQQRDQIVALGKDAVPALKQLAGLTNDSWKIQLMAGICRERIERGNDIKAMATKDWRKDSGWEKDWDYVTTMVPSYEYGATEYCKTLMVKRYREAGLWYYYIELFWKNTGETPNVGPYMGKREWDNLSMTALEGSPAVELLARIMEDGMLKAGGLNQYSVEYIVRNKVHSSLPALIAVWTNGNQDTVPLFVFQTVLDLAGTNDLNSLRAFMQEHPTAAHIDFVQHRIRTMDAAIGNVKTNSP